MTRVSTTSANAAANGASSDASFSRDGTKVVFTSSATNLTGDADTNAGTDIFIKDLIGGTVTRVSSTAGGAQLAGTHTDAVFSPDGTKVAFVTFNAGSQDVWVKDLVTGAVTKASVDQNGVGPAAGSSNGPVFSLDGTKIVFQSQNTTLAPNGDTNGTTDIFVKDLITGGLTRVSVNSAGDQAVGDGFQTFGVSFQPVGLFTSSDGVKVLYGSDAYNLVGDDFNGYADLFIGTTGYVEGGPAARIASNVSVGDSNASGYAGGSLAVAITADGRAGDVLSVANIGNGAGQIGVSGSTINFGGVAIGTLSGSGASLTVALNGSATNAAVKALAEAFRFANTGDDVGYAARQVSFTVTDAGGNPGGGADSASFAVRLLVSDINDAPAGADKSVSFAPGGTYVLTTADFGFTDPEGGPLKSVTITTTVGAGTLYYDPDGAGGAVPTPVIDGQVITAADIAAGKVSFDPGAGSGTGFASFTFQVTDTGGTLNGGVDTDASPNTITFNVVNAGPTAVDDPVAVLERLSTSGNALSNDSGGLTLTNIAVGASPSQPVPAGATGLTVAGTHGSLTIHQDGSYTYDATAEGLTVGQAYVDTFTYTATDSVTPVTAQLIVTVTGSPTGNAQDNVIVGSAGADSLTGLGGMDTLTGNGGADSLDGGSGADSMAGGTGDDVYVVDDAGDTITEAAGDSGDEVQTSLAVFTLGVTAGSAEVEKLTGISASGQQLAGSSVANVITGGVGDDIVIGGAGGDTLAGAGGQDLLDYSTEAGGSGVVVSLAGQSATDTFGATDQLSGFERVRGTAQVDILIGDGLANVLVGGGANDVMKGGAGDDVYEVTDSGDNVVENAGEGSDSVFAYLDFALGANIEVLSLQGSAVLGVGNALDNQLFGNSQANVLIGKGGSDLMVGGAGDDTYEVSEVGDTVLEAAGEGLDTVVSSVSYTLAANVENLALTGSATLAVGNGLDNGLFGNSLDNTLIGGAGNDAMRGMVGDDSYEVDSLGDVVIELLNQGTDTVYALISGYTLTAEVENLVLAGSATTGTGNARDNTMFGNAQANTLDGGSGKDLLFGGDGADTLAGGAGDDTLVGGNGADAFVWLTLGGKDVITDFAVVEDTVTVSSSMFANFADVQSRMFQSGADTVIGWSPSTVLVLKNVNMASLTASNFTFDASAPGGHPPVLPANPEPEGLGTSDWDEARGLQSESHMVQTASELAAGGFHTWML